MAKGPLPDTKPERFTAVYRSHEVAPRISVAVTEYDSRDLSLVDVNRAGRTKGATLAEWASARGIPRDEIMAVGDNLNDLEMLEFAGCPVVMGNAVPELKALGWPMTGTNDEAGVASAIENYALSLADR